MGVSPPHLIWLKSPLCVGVTLIRLGISQKLLMVSGSPSGFMSCSGTLSWLSTP